MTTKETPEYLDFLESIGKLLRGNKQILTANKSKVLKILFENSEHLSVEDILEISNSQKSNYLKRNTIYNTLASFETFGIVESVLIGHTKRYELSYMKRSHYHLYCQICSKIIEFENIDIHDKFLQELKNIKFQPRNFNIIINGICQKCQKKEKI